VTETAREIIPLFGQQRVLSWSTRTLSGTLARGLMTGAYVGNPLNACSTITMAALLTLPAASSLVRWQFDGARWLLYVYAAAVMSVVLIFSVKFFRSGLTPRLWDVAPVVRVATDVLIGTASFLRRSQKPSRAATKGIYAHGDGN
jgi:hypothetical protein